MTNNKTEITATPGKQEIFVKREFDAPRELVYRAFSEPELIVQWMGSRELKTTIDTLDVRSHGSWRFIMVRPDGVKMAFNGVIHEACPPERMIRTFEFEGLPEKGHVSLEFLTLETLPDNRTSATFQIVFKSLADRNNLVDMGMEAEFTNDHHRIDNLLLTLKAN